MFKKNNQNKAKKVTSSAVEIPLINAMSKFSTALEQTLQFDYIPSVSLT